MWSSRVSSAVTAEPRSGTPSGLIIVAMRSGYSTRNCSRLNMVDNASRPQAGTLDENARRAKADWLKLDPLRLRDFIAGQSDVRGVEIADIQYPASGAGSSNGIAM